jgi:MFS family permease
MTARPTHVRYAVLAAICTATLLAYVHRNCMGVAEKEMGVAMGAFFASYALLQIPTGALAQRRGTRWALPVFSVVDGVAMALGSLAFGLPSLLAARLALGTAQAGMLPAATGSVSKWFPATERGFASGTIGASLSIGAALGALLTGLLLERLGWRLLFALFAIPLFLWSVWFRAWFRNRPEEHAWVNAAEVEVVGGSHSAASQASKEPTPWGLLLVSPAMWCICLQQFFRAAAYMFYATWFATYLRDTREVSVELAGVLTSMPLVGVVLGSLLGGAVSDWILARTGSRRLGRQGVGVGSLLLGAGCILAARPITDATLAVAVLSLGAVVSSFAAPCAYAITIDMGGRHVAPVFATMNMVGNFGAMLFPVVVPWVVGEESRNWDRVLLMFAGIHLTAAFFWALLDPRGTVFGRHDPELASGGRQRPGP